MASTDDDPLFQLIRSLSKSEKRYFRLHASAMSRGASKKFVHLFDLIEKQKHYNEEKILRKAPHLKPIQLHNLKANLRKQVLRSLRLFGESSSRESTIRNWIEYARILYNKGLHAQAVKMLDKAKKEATQLERPALLLDILELEKHVVMQTVSEHNEERVAGLISETRTVARQIDNINRFSNLYARINSLYVKLGFIRNHKDHEKVRSFFFSGLPEYEEKKLSFSEKVYLYSSYVSYYFFVQDFRNGHRFALKYIQLFEEEPARITRAPELYIKGLNNLLVAENKLFLFREFEVSYKKLMRVHAIKGLHLTEHLQMMLFKYKYMHKINHYFMMGDFTGGTKIISVAESELERFAKRMDKHYVLLFYYKVACLYFGAGNFKRAAGWLNHIINSKDVDIREDILSFARILLLICHYELGNMELAQHNIRSIYRFLLKKEERFLYHRYILEFMRNLSPESRGKKLVKEFSALKKKLVPLEDHPYEKRPFLYFDIISWLESKIEKRPVEKIIREKFERRMRKT